jgi:hypothetical protein
VGAGITPPVPSRVKGGLHGACQSGSGTSFRAQTGTAHGPLGASLEAAELSRRRALVTAWLDCRKLPLPRASCGRP